jgi:hypothetical protein
MGLRGFVHVEVPDSYTDNSNPVMIPDLRPQMDHVNHKFKLYLSLWQTICRP